MNTNDLLNRIDNFKDEEHRKKREERKALLEKISELEQLVCTDYLPRVVELVKVANYCLAKGIDFTGAYWNGHKKGYKDDNFVADGIGHYLGFDMNAGWAHDLQHAVKGMAIEAGGCCGNRSLIINEENGVAIEVEDKGYSKPKYYLTDIDTEHDVEYLEEFINEFDAFESAFTNWVVKNTEVKE